MEAVALDAALADIARQREHPRQRFLGGVECGVETGDLRQVAVTRADGANGGEIVGLVQGRKRFQRAQALQHVGVDAHRFGEVGAAVNDTMADGDDGAETGLFVEPLQQPERQVLEALGGGDVAEGAGGPRARGEGEGRLRADAGYLAAQQRGGVLLGGQIEAELDRGGTDVQDQQDIAHAASPALRATTSCAIADDARRDTTPSARLVRMIGTRAPMTIPAASAPAR